MSQSKQSRREALRAQQEAEVRAAKRKKVIGVIAGVVVVVVAVVAGVFAFTNRSDSPSASGAQVNPPSADKDSGVYTIKSGTVKQGAPTLTIYEDYQCPICKQTEDTYGDSIRSLAKSGDIKLQYRTLTFLDDNMRNDSSYKAAMAAAGADMVGKLEAYHDVVYKNQPEQEGTGYTDEQLRTTFPKEAGITGADLTKFQKYYDDKATSDFVKNAASKGLAEGQKLAGDQFGTPFFTVNCKKYTDWQNISSPTPETLLASIKKAA
ncbi:thioredoxin [Acidipropionibacterium acidipropionici]|uniref:Thioredoxin n=1 Tax=Acidipropionibacterium acidipropionici TaxID=1748 RepID=A0AAC8YDT0_9ACTN|nr:thioredoxin domain-containing protein [Acidipropionibacterium acidipropionici]AMS04876.1 thioredoxin [Acidipropionibacterium acidipropionici]AOZ46360.1 thioredoxin [Acidipropionibacterium acidipropionici]AZP37598.1 thioredoxin [Acidipropionibacterium acidipropionici]